MADDMKIDLGTVIAGGIAGIVALASLVSGWRNSQRTDQLNKRLDTLKKGSRYLEPLIRAAFDLQKRLYNIFQKRPVYGDSISDAKEDAT